MAKERFDHVAIEKSAQEKWEALDIYTTDLTDSEKEPYYLLFEFPYPSGDLHIGHWFAFALTDIFARFKRMQGKNVLFPMGFDSFGLPAENAAIKNGADPAIWTNANMERMRAQVKTMGTSVDWSKEVVTSSPEYYKWTQWLFSKLYDHGLAYRKEAAVKWCPKDQTVLANEQVIDGKCERCDSEVEEKFLTQWFMGITKYAERLLTDLDPLPWREEMKDAQRAWIGKSEGAKLTFPILFADQAKNEWRDEEGNPAQVSVFTTRPDTVFGATYVVLAPEHPWVAGALEHGTDVFSNEKEVRAYIQETSKKTERERLENKEKTGIELKGIRAVNPATQEEIPVFIADYVLASYGTGAVMAVPAHDERDYAFAKSQNEALSRSNKPLNLIFDFDGVIGDSFESVIQALVAMGHEVDLDAAREHVLNYARTKPIHTRDHSLTPEALSDEYAWVGRLGEVMKAMNIPLFEAFVQEILRIPNARIAVVSSGSESYIKPAIGRTTLKPTHILGFENHHSKEEKIEIIAKDWNVSVDEVYYFTDTKADYFELENHLDRNKLFGCSWGYLGKEELLTVMQPAQVLENFVDIHRIFKKDPNNSPLLSIRRVIDPVTGDEQVEPLHKGKIVAVVEYEGKVLSIHWKPELGGRLLVGGTVEEDEDPAVTAAREITEETGYTDLELVERADEMVHHGYFAFSKNQATLAHTTLLHFRLNSDACDEQKLEDNEKGKFEVEWVTVEQAEREIHDDQHLYTLARFMRPGAYTGDGLLRNSGQFDGRDNREAMGEIVDFVGGELVTNYRLRDWLVSRQRYWGCPIPVVYDPEGTPHLIPAEHLPWTLPTDVDFSPSSESPLATSKELKERVVRIFGEGWTPEYDTLDTFVDSSWYFLRYLDSKDEDDFSDQSLLKKWLPVNRYSGGSEHTTMHLLYSRFFHKALYDLALVPTPEPFEERFNRGLILGTDGQKMSKRWGNVVNPDEVVAKFGSDAVRMYLAFIGPYNEPGSYPWKLDGAVAMRKFLDRVYQLSEKVIDVDITESERTSLAKAVKKITGDTERFKFNTAISGHMVFARELESADTVSKEVYLALLTLLAPFAPHLAEHLWERMGGEGSIHQALWPEEIAIQEDTVVIGVQVNGKRRGEITLAPDASEEEAMEAARANETIGRLLHEGRIEKIIYVPGRILNMVIR